MKLVHLVGFITKKFVMMHGDMDVKLYNIVVQVKSDFKENEFFICRSVVCFCPQTDC